VALSRRRMLQLTLCAAAGGGATASTAALCAHADRVRPRGVSPRPDPPALTSPSAVAELFRPGTRHVLDIGEPAVAATQPAGVLHMPTGRLFAVDPSWLYLGPPPGVAPFTVSVPPGDYPLTLALVVWSQTRVAAAKLTVRDEPVASWEMALRPGQDPATLPEHYFFGVGVDIAAIALFDAVALSAMVRRVEKEPTAFDFPKGGHFVELVDPVPGANVLAFETGWGDGSYPVWIGRTPGGKVACYLVDMLMLAPDTPAPDPHSPVHDPSGSHAR
jgi:hypothetical protein